MLSDDELRALADRVSYAATFLMRPGMPSSYWDACNRAADYLRLQAHTHPAQAEPKREPRVKPTHEAADAFWRYWHEQAEPQCRCRACLALLAEPVVEFTVCPQCGNKRCPKADDHRNACTGSNEPGQVAQAADRGLRANLLQRDREQLERTNRLLRESLADVIKLLDHAPPRTPADDEIIRRATRALTLGSLL